MKCKFLMSLMFSLFILVGAHAGADEPNIGAPLPLKMNPNNSPQFGASYTYGDDQDGANYLLNVSAKSTNPQEFRWNFYLSSANSYLMEWSSNRTTFAAVTQIKISDVAVVSKLLAGQKKVNGKAELYFVLANENNVPIYNVSISDLCASFPQTFHNLTSDKSCDQF